MFFVVVVVNNTCGVGVYRVTISYVMFVIGVIFVSGNKIVVHTSLLLMLLQVICLFVLL